MSWFTDLFKSKAERLKAIERRTNQLTRLKKSGGESAIRVEDSRLTAEQIDAELERLARQKAQL